MKTLELCFPELAQRKRYKTLRMCSAPLRCFVAVERILFRSLQSLVNIWILRLETRSSSCWTEEKIIQWRKSAERERLVKRKSLGDNKRNLNCEKSLNKRKEVGKKFTMNACCSIVKFFVVLMNLVFWVSSSNLQFKIWRNSLGLRNISLSSENFIRIVKKSPFPISSSISLLDEKNAKTTPLSHTPTQRSQHHNTRSIAAERASCWENVKGMEMCLLCVELFHLIEGH